MCKEETSFPPMRLSRRTPGPISSPLQQLSRCRKVVVMADEAEKNKFTRRGFLGVGSAALGPLRACYPLKHYPGRNNPVKHPRAIEAKATQVRRIRTWMRPIQIRSIPLPRTPAECRPLNIPFRLVTNGCKRAGGPAKLRYASFRSPKL
jgi:hypothetical protein